MLLEAFEYQSFWKSVGERNHGSGNRNTFQKDALGTQEASTSVHVFHKHCKFKEISCIT